ncbi:MAG: type VII toxin-antitoxin system HepT family RNase toxin [Campylobacterales bacterium]
MNFQKCLETTKASTNTERGLLDSLVMKFKDRSADLIDERAAERSLQILSENLIGKLKKILQHYNSPVVPDSGYDAVEILRNIGAISDEDSSFFRKILGFRNALVHDYMNFDREIVKKIILSRDYEKLCDFLVDEVEYSEVIRRRIENITL